MSNRMSDDVRKGIVEAWNNGASIFKIIGEFEFSKGSIDSVLDQAFEVGATTKSRKVRANLLEKLRVLASENKDWTLDQFIEATGGSWESVRNYLRGAKYGIGFEFPKKKVIGKEDIFALVVLRINEDKPTAEIIAEVKATFGKDISERKIEDFRLFRSIDRGMIAA
jgi:hypothetical protein